MKLGDKAIINDGVHGLPNGTELVFIGMSYDDEEALYVFKSSTGMHHHLMEKEFKWEEELVV